MQRLIKDWWERFWCLLVWIGGAYGCFSGIFWIGKMLSQTYGIFWCVAFVVITVCALSAAAIVFVENL